MSTRHCVWFRRLTVVNTDPQRRCYNGCNFSEEEVLLPWEHICTYASKEDAETSAACFKSINPRHEYKVLPEGEQP